MTNVYITTLLRKSCHILKAVQRKAKKKIYLKQQLEKPVCFRTTSISASLFPMSAFVSFFSAHKITASCGATQHHVPNSFFPLLFHPFFVRALWSRHVIFRFLFILNFSINFFRLHFIGRSACASSWHTLVVIGDVYRYYYKSRKQSAGHLSSSFFPQTPHANEKKIVSRSKTNHTQFQFFQICL